MFLGIWKRSNLFLGGGELIFSDGALYGLGFGITGI